MTRQVCGRCWNAWLRFAAEFRRTLRVLDITRLTTRRSPRRWSVIEICTPFGVFRRPVYSPLVRLERQTMDQLGLVPAFLANDPKYASVGTEPTNDLETVLSAWKRFMDRLRNSWRKRRRKSYVKSRVTLTLRGSVGRVLQGLAQHDLMRSSGRGSDRRVGRDHATFNVSEKA